MVLEKENIFRLNYSLDIDFKIAIYDDVSVQKKYMME